MMISFLREVIIFAEQLWCTLSIWRQSDRQLIKAFVIIKNGFESSWTCPLPPCSRILHFSKENSAVPLSTGTNGIAFFPIFCCELCVQDTHRDRYGCIVLVAADKYCIYNSFSLSCCVASANPCTCNPKFTNSILGLKRTPTTLCSVTRRKICTYAHLYNLSSSSDQTALPQLLYNVTRRK